MSTTQWSVYFPLVGDDPGAPTSYCYFLQILRIWRSKLHGSTQPYSRPLACASQQCIRTRPFILRGDGSSIVERLLRSWSASVTPISPSPAPSVASGCGNCSEPSVALRARVMNSVPSQIFVVVIQSSPILHKCGYHPFARCILMGQCLT